MARQQVRITPYYMVESFWETDIPTQYMIYFDSKEELFYNAAKFYAFDDTLDGELTIDEIYCEGKKCHYIGWRPGMRYVFKDTEDEVVWDSRYPEWDH